MLRFGNFSSKIELGERKRNKNYKQQKQTSQELRNIETASKIQFNIVVLVKMSIHT